MGYLVFVGREHQTKGTNEMMYRLETNLTKLTNTQLKNIVKTCVKKGIEFYRFQESYDNLTRYTNSRKDVKLAAAAIDCLEYDLTETIRIPPSQESLAWSNLEGGHTFHKKPDIKIADLL